MRPKTAGTHLTNADSKTDHPLLEQKVNMNVHSGSQVPAWKHIPMCLKELEPKLMMLPHLFRVYLRFHRAESDHTI